eukprot:131662_1
MQQQQQQQNDPNQIGRAFVKHYYEQFDSNRKNLANLFTNKSMMTYEGKGFQGQNNIMQRLTSLGFNKIKHEPKTMDCQPSGANGILVIVTGDVYVDDSKNPIKFSETFQLMPTDQSCRQFWIHNDVFRLNYC